jgi:hypothetical protein
MPKCAVVGCKNKPVGGIQELIETGGIGEPTQYIPNLITAWCKEHENDLRRHVHVQHFRELTKAELEGKSPS